MTQRCKFRGRTFRCKNLQMKKPAKHGWFFSAFAGIFAIALMNVLQLLTLVIPGLPRSLAVVPIVLDLYVGACAFAAARVAGWVVRMLGGADCGWGAGTVTAPLFLVFLLFPAAVSLITAPRVQGLALLPVLLISSVYILPFSLLGTAIFLGGLRLWRRIVPVEDGIVRLFD